MVFQNRSVGETSDGFSTIAAKSRVSSSSRAPCQTLVIIDLQTPSFVGDNEAGRKVIQEALLQIKLGQTPELAHRAR